MVAFKWRHWGKMTGKLVCPVGPETKLEALPTNQEVELFGVCVAHMDSDLKLSKLEVTFPYIFNVCIMPYVTHTRRRGKDLGSCNLTRCSLALGRILLSQH